MSMNPDGVRDSIDTLDEQTQKFVKSFKPELETKLKKLMTGEYDYSIGIGVAHPSTGPKIEIDVGEEYSLKKCSALRFINKNQKNIVKGSGDFTFIRHIDISDESNDNDKRTKKEIIDFKKRGIRCSSYPVDNSWILD